MSFWDDFAVKVSIACDNLRETKVGAKIMQNVEDSVCRYIDKVDRMEEQVNILFMEDVVTEGKKRGYTKAAEEYEKTYRTIEAEYRKTIQLLTNQKLGKDEKFQSLIKRLQQLEQERKNLEQKFRRDVNYAAVRHGIPNTKIMSAFSGSSIEIRGDLYTGGLLDLLCSGKEKKLKKAEAEGYREAKELFLKKLSKKQAEMDAAVNKAQGELSHAACLIKKALKAIADEETKIAELRIVLGA